MKKFITFLVMAIGCTVLFAGIATAQTTATIKPGKGLVAAMHAAGCNQTWLSRVAADNKIAFGDLRHLRAGTPITLPAQCADRAPDAIAEQSTLMIRMDQKNVSEEVYLAHSKKLETTSSAATTTSEGALIASSNVRELQMQVNALRTVNTDLNKQLAAIRATDVGDLKFKFDSMRQAFLDSSQKLDDLIKKGDTPTLPNTSKDTASLRSESWSWSSRVVLIGGLCIIFGIAGHWYYGFQKGKEEVRIPQFVRVFDPQGRLVVFQLASYDARNRRALMACGIEGCGERCDPLDCAEHMWDPEFHASLRISVLNASVA